MARLLVPGAVRPRRAKLPESGEAVLEMEGEIRMAMFIAMNQFTVDPERGAEFEDIWRKRESFLHEVPGFVRFALLRGDEAGVYVSHSAWTSREAFEGWAKSDAFRKGHAQARTPAGILVGHPKLMTFEAVLEQSR